MCLESDEILHPPRIELLFTKEGFYSVIQSLFTFQMRRITVPLNLIRVK